jgi:hypothetical protein
MALGRRVTESSHILSELYADTFPDISDDECETETWGCDVTASN